MHLLPGLPRFEGTIRRRFRTSPLGPALASFWMLAFAVLFVGLGGPAAESFPWFAWIVAGPLVMITGAIALLMFLVFVHALRATLRSSNWILATSREGVYLNLRSYLNAHFEGPELTVAFVPFAEIASVARVKECWEQTRRDEVETRQHAFLEIVLSNVDTAPLAEAVRAERTKAPPERSLLGIKMRSKSNDVPVHVPGPGVVRVQWRSGMLAALEEHVRVLGTRKVDLTETLAASTTEERCLALLRRGEKIAAVESARSGFGVGLAEARDRVEQLEKNLA